MQLPGIVVAIVCAAFWAAVILIVALMMKGPRSNDMR